jgi:hypothetical protein
MICGVNGCSHHHDPFFHWGAEDQVIRAEGGEGGEPPADSWAATFQRHVGWEKEVEITYQEKQLTSRHERMRVLEILGDHRPVEVRYENLRNMPPYSFRRNEIGEVVMSERTFRTMSNAFSHNGLLAEMIAGGAVRRMLIELDPETRRKVLAEEITLAARNRDHPKRLARMRKGATETDEGFALRVAKRALALELLPPTKLRRQNPTDTSDSEAEQEEEVTGGDAVEGSGAAEGDDVAERSTVSGSSDSDESESDEDSESDGGGEGGRPPGLSPRPVLSGSPYEEEPQRGASDSEN